MKMLLSLIKFICIVSALVSPIALTVNLISSPWPGDEIAKSETKGYLGIPIGGSFVGDVRKSKGYLLFPLSMSLPKYFKKTKTVWLRKKSIDFSHEISP